MTLFEGIIAREIAADICYEDDHCIAFHDVNPQAPVHVLLVPKKVIKKLSDISSTDQMLLGHLMTTIPTIVEQVCPGQDFRIVINNGLQAGQSVFHLHVHILAGRAFDWPPG